MEVVTVVSFVDHIARTDLVRTPDYTYKGLFRGGLILSGQILAIWVDFVRIFEVASEIFADLSGSVK